MARSVTLLLVILVVLSAHSGATAQGLLGERHIGLSFDMSSEGDKHPLQGVTAGINLPFGRRFDAYLGLSRLGFDGTYRDASVVGLGLCLHGQADSCVVPYLDVSGAAKFARHYEVYAAGLDAGVQFTLSNRVALKSELGFGIADRKFYKAVTFYSLGLSTDMSLTERLSLLLGVSVGYDPESYADNKSSIGAAIGFAWRL